jgi:hypothetical protein
LCVGEWTVTWKMYNIEVIMESVIEGEMKFSRLSVKTA